MPTKIGHFEILSELAKSATATVYKADDPQSGQTIALKVIRLSAFGESAAALESALLAEAESTKSLASPNIAPVFGAGEIEGQFCAAMEYVQGNSIATMLARQERFSIWDLLDIGRQVCSGLDHASGKRVFHFSLEPAKIMCGWDGTVRILSLGASSAGKFAPQTSDPPAFLHYMSPEQLNGEAIDGRSNLFGLGAMFYEMVTQRKPFEGADIDSVCRSILQNVPPSPARMDPRIHPLLGDLIMKALHKDPGQRYQSGRELLDDLERCKESKAPSGQKPAPAPATAAITGAGKNAAQSKFAAPPAPGLAQPPAAPVGARAGMSSRTAETRPLPQPTGYSVSPAVPVAKAPAMLDATQHMPAPPKPATAASAQPSVYLSTAKEQVTNFAASAPKLAVDPLMAESPRAGTTSFSEIAELPPLKEIYVEPAPPSPEFATESAAMPGSTVYRDHADREEKPKVQPREVAQKAIKEIRNVPPRLILYSLGGALALILVIAIALAVHIHYLNSEIDSGAGGMNPGAQTPAPMQTAPAPQAGRETAPSPASKLAQTQAEVEPSAVVRPAAPARHVRSNNKKTPPAAPLVIPGQMVLDSTPQGAQAQIDGRSDPTYVTPFLLPGMAPGPHTITVSKAGYSSDSRQVEIASGNKTSVLVRLAQLMATLAVSSSPAGASVFVDGKDTGKATPAQVSLDKGQHVILIRKMGYLDETATPQLVLGQTTSLSPVLRPLGNAENIRTVNKIPKLFGGARLDPGQVTVSIKTQPKGAQVTVNQRMLEKASPVEVALDPGNYVIDITLTGYAPIHKVVTAEKGSKLVVDEILQRQ